MATWVWVDGREIAEGEPAIPATDPGFLLGWTAFDSLVVPAPPERLTAHLQRLEASARELRVPFPGEDALRADLGRVERAVGGAARVRVTLTRGGLRVVAATPIDRSRWLGPVRAARGPHRDEPFLGGRPKHGSRAPWAVAVERSGVDDVLLVDADGRFTEATTAGIVASIGGRLWTAPDDGRILPSTTVLAVCETAAKLGVEVIRMGPPADGGWDGLYVASSTRGLAPVIALDGAPLPGWDPVGRRVADALPWGA
jgi:4-amino-4-deoxychorismate lyase